jgi:hypothetical protein
VARVSPVLGRLGQRLFLLGDDPGAANLMKVAANALTPFPLSRPTPRSKNALLLYEDVGTVTA